MNTSPILTYAKKLIGTPQTKEEEQAKRELIYENFPKVAEALDVLEEALVFLQEHDPSSKQLLVIKQCFSRIHSLTPKQQ